MAHYDDLAPCDYFPFLNVDRLLAVGWLGKGFEYSRGDPGEAVYKRLEELLSDAWQPVLFMGWHSCELCDDADDSNRRSFDHLFIDGRKVTYFVPDRSRQSYHNLFIPGPNVTYVAPEGILHYISAHGYCPPSEFCEAVLACPDMETREYFARLEACGWARYFEEEAASDDPFQASNVRARAAKQTGMLLVSRIEAYRVATGYLPDRLPSIDDFPPENGSWEFEVQDRTLAEIVKRACSMFGLCARPPQTYRLTFTPAQRLDAHLTWTCAGGKAKITRSWRI